MEWSLRIWCQERIWTCAKPVKTAGSKQRYNFDRHDKVFSNGGYHVFTRSGFSSACFNKQIWTD